MAEIEYRPWKKIVVHEVAELTTKQFFEGLAVNAEAMKVGVAPVVFWVNGIAFVSQLMSDSNHVAEERIKGILHYNTVQFTRTDFQEEKKVVVMGRDVTIKMIKQEKNPDLVNLAKFLSSRPALPAS